MPIRKPHSQGFVELTEEQNLPLNDELHPDRSTPLLSTGNAFEEHISNLPCRIMEVRETLLQGGGVPLI